LLASPSRFAFLPPPFSAQNNLSPSVASRHDSTLMSRLTVSASCLSFKRFVATLSRGDTVSL
ncbi:hypothetical protein A2U01_0116234, partial [Trifolium medium]|nr:hypothetical protein [Trifolium medium]